MALRTADEQVAAVSAADLSRPGPGTEVFIRSSRYYPLQQEAPLGNDASLSLRATRLPILRL